MSTSAPLPFPVHEATAVPEELRVRHRYLGLRRARDRSPGEGLAPEADRTVVLLPDEPNTRELAFPLSQSAEDLMMGAPSAVQLKTLRIRWTG